MKHTLLLILLVLFALFSFSQKDSIRTNELCLSINPVLFADYNGVSIYPGFDLNLYYRHKQILAEFGVLGGNTYPVLPYLNYYIGTGLSLPFKNKWELQAKTRFMFSYFTRMNNQNSSYTIYQESLLVGAGFLKTIKRLKLGIECYLWWSNYKYEIFYFFYPPNANTNIILKNGFVNTGIFVLKVGYILKK
ncbi:MAG: hypothetical protein JWO32_2126 [Bacteroidetes bacterium]|nr:hypothetical protein [Bacteroidota bacterium]